MARDAGVFNGHDRELTRRDRAGDERFVEVERVGAHFDELTGRAAKHERVRRGDERVRRHDHFVARSDLGEQRRHLERRGARVRQQRAFRVGLALQPFLREAAEAAVAGKVRGRDRFGDVAQLVARLVRLVERDHAMSASAPRRARMLPMVAGPSANSASTIDTAGSYGGCGCAYGGELDSAYSSALPASSKRSGAMYPRADGPLM